MGTKPDDIPQDVFEVAFALVSDIQMEDAGSLAGWNGLASIERIARAILAAKAEEREAIIQVCEAEKLAFRSPEYAANQPLGSLCERFAISECIAAIRKRGEA